VDDSSGPQFSFRIWRPSSQIGFLKLHEWLRSEVIESGRGSLDEGHLPTATERQPVAAIEHLGSGGFLSGSNGLKNAALAIAMKWID